MTDELDPERLRRLTEAAVALPRSIEPTRDAWPAIRGRIEAGRVRAIASPAPPARPASPWRAGRLAAAAVLLVVASSGLTALLLRERRAKAAIVRPAGPARHAHSLIEVPTRCSPVRSVVRGTRGCGSSAAVPCRPAR